MESYDSSSETYDELYQEEQMAKYMRGLRMIPGVGGSVVLDAGCGSGLFLKLIAGFVKLAIGLDFSRRMLEIARRNVDRRSVELVLGDVEHLPFKDGSFDKVFMFTVLQNVPKPFKALREVYNATTDDGYLVASFLKRVYSKGEVERLLNECGFRSVVCSCDGVKDYVFACRKL